MTKKLKITPESSSQPNLSNNISNETPDLDGSIWLATNNQSWGSHRRMTLLQAIDETGSISAGAKKVGISYKGAWDAIETMNSITNQTLVTRTLGGVGGGGAQLTEKAKQMVALYNSLNKAHSEFIKHLSNMTNDDSPDLDIINNLGLSGSTRNKLSGIIRSIESNQSYVEINIDIGNKNLIVANISPSLWHELKLQKDEKILIFIDAANILLSPSKLDNQLSARNQLKGNITNIEDINGNCNVTVTLAPNILITSQVTANSVKRLNLKINAPVSIIFKSSSVTLGKPLN